MTDDQKPNEDTIAARDHERSKQIAGAIIGDWCNEHGASGPDYDLNYELLEAAFVKRIEREFDAIRNEDAITVSATYPVAASDDCRHPADAFFMDFLAKESPRLGGLSYQDQQVIVRGLKKFASQATAASVTGAQWTADDIAKADAKAAKWYEHFHGAQGGQDPSTEMVATRLVDRYVSARGFCRPSPSEEYTLIPAISAALDAFAARQGAEAVAAEREACAKWHDEQHGAWLDQARNAQRLSQSSDDADQQEYRRQHEHYAALAIIHRQSAAAIRNRP